MVVTLSVVVSVVGDAELVVNSSTVVELLVNSSVVDQKLSGSLSTGKSL